MRLLNTGARRFDKWLQTLDRRLRQLPNVVVMVKALKRLHLVPSSYLLSPPSYRFVLRWHPQNACTSWADMSLDPSGKFMWRHMNGPVKSMSLAGISTLAMEPIVESNMRLLAKSLKGMPEKV